MATLETQEQLSRFSESFLGRDPDYGLTQADVALVYSIGDDSFWLSVRGYNVGLLPQEMADKIFALRRRKIQGAA